MTFGISRRNGTVLSITTLLFILIFLYQVAIAGVQHQISRSFSHARHPQWLIATMSPAHSIQRRMIIRQTWQRLFSDPLLWTTKFVIARAANPTWQAIIDAENGTYGDIIQLTHLEENSYVANTVKTIEFFKYLTRLEGKPETTHGLVPEYEIVKWKFVSKIDDDSFLDAKSFYGDYLLPLQHGNRTILARTIYQPNYTVPGGQFYTMTSDMVSLLANLHTENPISDEAEDVLVGRLLYEANKAWSHVDLPNPIAFDYEETQLREEGKGFAAENADLTTWRHAVGPGAINPHKMRDDETYVKVAACFNGEGVLA